MTSDLIESVAAREIPKPESSQIPDGAAEILDRKRRSWNWMKASFWDEFQTVYQNYRGERDPEKDPNDPSKIDTSQTSIAMPDTWSLVRRLVARVTAQPPSLKFRADDPDVASRISRALMYQWDRAQVQRYQKRHVTQAGLFGWSVRPWYWAVDEFMRKRRVNPLDPQWTEQVFEQYADKIQGYLSAEGIAPDQAADPQLQTALAGRLMGEVGRGNLVPIQYLYKCYEGPKTDFLFVGDCYPEPQFQTLQSSNWFIVERRRNREWIESLVRLYGEKYPDVAKGFEQLLKDYPNGSARDDQREMQQLRTSLNAAAGRSEDLLGSDSGRQSSEWTITEMHVPGRNASISYLGESSVWLGKIPYPYELDGKIAFTELTLIDDILCGIGDSHARVIRGLQELHNRQVCQRTDLIYNVLRPLMWTKNKRILKNPGLLHRGPGFRLIEVESQGDLGVLGEQAALAAASASISDTSDIMRLIQMATGENNMSNAANIDPSQNRTATGARIMAFNADILTKDLVDKFSTTSIEPDLEMMYLLNRSELTEPIGFDGSQYNRQYSAGAPTEGQPQQQPQMMTATPEDFQYDGQVIVEVGSTLADDDDSNVTKAQALLQAALSAPNLFNAQAAAQDYIIALGKGRELQKYMAPPPQPPPPPEPKGSISGNVKLETLTRVGQAKILNGVGFEIAPEDILPVGILPSIPPNAGPSAPAGGPASFSAPPAMRPQRVPLPQPEPDGGLEMPFAAQSFNASRGRGPMDGGA
jgi:hypothetical protein